MRDAAAPNIVVLRVAHHFARLAPSFVVAQVLDARRVRALGAHLSLCAQMHNDDVQKDDVMNNCCFSFKRQ